MSRWLGRAVIVVVSVAEVAVFAALMSVTVDAFGESIAIGVVVLVVNLLLVALVVTAVREAATELW